MKDVYGISKDRGTRPSHHALGSGKIIRTIIHQLEKVKLVEKLPLYVNILLIVIYINNLINTHLVSSEKLEEDAFQHKEDVIWTDLHARLSLKLLQCHNECSLDLRSLPNKK